MVSPRTKVIQDYYWLEDAIGPLIPVEVVLQMPSADERSILEQYRTVKVLSDELNKLDPNYCVISSATFLPEPPTMTGGIGQITQAAIFRRQLWSNQSRLSEIGYLHVDEHSNFWRITIRTPATEEIDYGLLLADVQNVVDTTFANGDLEPEQVNIAGGVPLIYQVQEQLLSDLIKSFLLAFVLVGMTLMVLFRSIRCGFICMIPNILPSAIVFRNDGLAWR